MLRPVGEAAGSLTEARKLSAARTEHRSLLERLRCLNYAAHSVRTHASADKAGKLLAWLIQRDCDRGPIVEIRSRAGGMVHTPREIHAEFTRLYGALYASGTPPAESLCNDFLADVELPCLEEEQMEALEVPLDLEEIKSSIGELAFHWSRSSLFPFDPELRDLGLILAGTPVLWQPCMIRYLGIRVYHREGDLIDGNLTRVVTSIIYFRQDAACPHCCAVGADLLHMLWSCPSLCSYWKAVVTCLSECTARRVPFTWEVCMLGLFPRGKEHRAAVRFTDLGLITAKRLVIRRWKSSDPPPMQAWRCSFEVWAMAEGAALREEVLGLHQFPLSASWEELMSRLRSMSGSPEAKSLV
ncbi:hypothetical protein NDU88_002646 [Pleurodeles waltl]|uniref:Reverse transcriptase zinc-binding domain-containing protein n=1 Tax=Pleurodeles waltl TaxID=8319 RepID=A0AAV7REL4_PLEWA|nr:hypothetical protein NDU88_002646 [Pleurodeles waltl]